jgi:hypothetical protein
LALLGPSALIEITPSVSVGTSRQKFVTTRGYSLPGGKSGLMSSNVGLPRFVWLFPAAPMNVTPRARA